MYDLPATIYKPCPEYLIAIYWGVIFYILIPKIINRQIHFSLIMSSDGTEGPVLVRGIKADNPGMFSCQLANSTFMIHSSHLKAKPPVRIEVRDMIKDHPDQWNLYLLGLERFQNSVKEDSPLSFFEIAGKYKFFSLCQHPPTPDSTVAPVIPRHPPLDYV